MNELKDWAEVFCKNCAKPFEVPMRFAAKALLLQKKRAIEEGMYFCSPVCQTEWFERNERD